MQRLLGGTDSSGSLSRYFGATATDYPAVSREEMGRNGTHGGLVLTKLDIAGSAF